MTDTVDVPDIRLTEDERELVRLAGFGLEVEGFVESAVGQYLFKLANEMEMGCDEQLRIVNPTDLKTIVDLQVKARAAGFLKGWLLEAVRLGLEATREAEAASE